MDQINLLAIAAVTLGIGVQAWMGLGFGLLSAPLLYLISPDYVPGPILMLGFILSAMVIVKNRQQVNWTRTLPATLARIPGAWIGAVLLAAMPQHILSIVLGSALLLAIWISTRHIQLQTTPLSLTTAGFFSGVLGTATSVGGPPMALVYQHKDRVTTRNDLALFFLLSTPVSIIMLALNGWFTLQTVYLTLPLIPGVALGYLLAEFLAGRFQEATVKKLIIALSVLAAWSVLLDGLKGLFGA